MGKKREEECWIFVSNLQIGSETMAMAAIPSICITNNEFNIRNGSRINAVFTNSSSIRRRRRSVEIRAIKEETKQRQTTSSSSSPDEITQKYGLEVGLWKIFSSKEEEEDGDVKKKSKGDQAKELLTKYGGAYLATSITLSLISFSLCYALITAGVDVQALLQKVGISANETGEKVGTFALAYAAHKAASPIRFPPTVALTPIVASWIGKKVDKDD
ncbi:hypothetical protein L1987_33172 [Smallanthus sonchifolius]|uniref:Uncharacterized protein n=1 Tax=Smallanthus sonchifolius TaxID=185202 RepID=A0ACB9HR53_9ASTR|nr:hypothetical protein L1987_33172 [Smallanthus sonchifolius]